MVLTRRRVGLLLTTLGLVATWVLVLDAATPREPILGGPCEGCELVFEGLPEKLGAQASVAPEAEPGEALVLEGTVRTPAGQPAAGIVVYAYHTDRGGLYPDDATRHGRLRGWARTDAGGGYRFDTIRPGAYPEQRVRRDITLGENISGYETSNRQP